MSTLSTFRSAVALVCLAAAGCQCGFPAPRRSCSNVVPGAAVQLTDDSIEHHDLAPIPEAEDEETALDRSEAGNSLANDPAVDPFVQETEAPVVTVCPGDTVVGLADGHAPLGGIQQPGVIDEAYADCATNPPWWRFSRWRPRGGCFPIWCGPLFHRKAGPGLVEEELRPPHSRFHPVPTRPVFEPRLDYAVPELMMTETKRAAGPPTNYELPLGRQ
jgi:hypothetical protein